MPSMFTVKGVEDLAACYTDIIDYPDKGVADVTFKVGCKRFGSLRKVLSVRCAVFDGMFSRGFKEAVAIEDVSFPQFDDMAKAFRAFLLYMHVGETSLEDLPCDLHQIADYFGVVELKGKCADAILSAELSSANALDKLKFATTIGDKSLYNVAANFILGNAEHVFADIKQAVSRTPHAFFQELFQAEVVNASETLLFKILLATAPEQQRALLPLIRLQSIQPLDILSIVAPSNLISKDELMKVLAHQADPVNVALSEGHVPRKRRKMCVRLGKGTTIDVTVFKSSDIHGLPVKIAAGSEDMLIELKDESCLRFDLQPSGVQLWDFFNKVKLYNLEDKLQSTLKSGNIVGGQHILLVEALPDGSFP